jgi:hypothetical protein
MELLGHTPNFNGLFSDKRLDKRAALVSQTIFKGKTSSVHCASNDEAELKGFYRFLENVHVTEDILISELTNRCRHNVFDRDVLVIQDSCSFGLNHNSKNIKNDSGVGFVGNKNGVGFLSHCSLVLDATHETVLGFSDVQLWHRQVDKCNNTTQAYKKEPIELKESNKWLKASKQSKSILASAKSVTIIEDREGDIYEQFCKVPDAKTHLVIRSRENRKLVDGQKLHSALSQSNALGHYAINILGDSRKEKTKRVAQVELKAIAVNIAKPTSLKRKDVPEMLSLYAVEVKEINGNDKNKICWRILTTKEVTNYEEAIAIIEKYKQRWYIEQLFRLLKKQGFKIEDTQLESGWSIRKLLVLILNTALRLMQIYLAYDVEESQPIEEVFSEEEIKCLQMVEQKQIKKTTKTDNPFSNKKLSWASWIIARLGGWKGNKKQRVAGPIVLKRGLEKFQMIFEGWQMAKNFT